MLIRATRSISGRYGVIREHETREVEDWIAAELIRKGLAEPAGDAANFPPARRAGGQPGAPKPSSASPPAPPHPRRISTRSKGGRGSA